MNSAASVLRWGLLTGGLIIVADLATLVAQQRLVGPELAEVLEILDLVVSAVLYSVAGASVARETGRVALGAAAGLLAGMLAGLVVGAAVSMAPPRAAQVATPDQLYLETFMLNMAQGTLLATISAWFGRMARQRSGS